MRQCGRPIKTYAFPEHPNALRAYLASKPPDRPVSMLASTLCAVELAQQFSGRAFANEGIESVARLCVRRTLATRLPGLHVCEVDRIAAHYIMQLKTFAKSKCELKQLSPLYALEPEPQFKESQIFELE